MVRRPPRSTPYLHTLSLHDALPISIGGFIVAMVTVFKKTWAPITAPLYALLEGFFIGGISAIFEAKYPGIVMQAVGLTRSEEHTSELESLMRISYAVFCLKKKNTTFTLRFLLLTTLPNIFIH